VIQAAVKRKMETEDGVDGAGEFGEGIVFKGFHGVGGKWEGI